MRAVSDIHTPVIQPDCERSHLSYIQAGQGTQKVQLLWIVLGLRSSIFLVELGAGLWLHSLSLLAGSGDVFSDMVALGLTLMATKLAQRPSTGRATFGYQRLEILVALLNGLGMIAIAARIAWEAVGRFQTPDPVLGLPMLIVAALSLAVNSLNIYLLHSDSAYDLNLRGAFLRIVADATSSFGVILAALAVYFFNWLWPDGGKVAPLSPAAMQRLKTLL